MKKTTKGNKGNKGMKVADFKRIVKTFETNIIINLNSNKAVLYNISKNAKFEFFINNNNGNKAVLIGLKTLLKELKNLKKGNIDMLYINNNKLIIETNYKLISLEYKELEDPQKEVLQLIDTTLSTKEYNLNSFELSYATLKPFIDYYKTFSKDFRDRGGSLNCIRVEPVTDDKDTDLTIVATEGHHLFRDTITLYDTVSHASNFSITGNMLKLLLKLNLKDSHKANIIFSFNKANEPLLKVYNDSFTLFIIDSDYSTYKNSYNWRAVMPKDVMAHGKLDNDNVIKINKYVTGKTFNLKEYSSLDINFICTKELLMPLLKLIDLSNDVSFKVFKSSNSDYPYAIDIEGKYFLLGCNAKCYPVKTKEVKTKEVKTKEPIKLSNKFVKVNKLENYNGLRSFLKKHIGLNYDVKYKFYGDEPWIFVITEDLYNTTSTFSFSMSPQFTRCDMTYKLRCEKIKTPITGATKTTVNSGCLYESIKELKKISDIIFMVTNDDNKPLIFYAYDIDKGMKGGVYAVILAPVSNSNSNTNNIPIKAIETKPKDPVKTKEVKTKSITEKIKEAKEAKKFANLQVSKSLYSFFSSEILGKLHEDLISSAKSLYDDLFKQVITGNTAVLNSLLVHFSKFFKYSLLNNILIASQAPKASYVAGFATWKTFKRFVKRGSKGITILQPIPCTKTVKEIEPDTGKEVEKEKNYCRFKTIYIFDLEQTTPYTAGEAFKPAVLKNDIEVDCSFIEQTANKQLPAKLAQTFTSCVKYIVNKNIGENAVMPAFKQDLFKDLDYDILGNFIKEVLATSQVILKPLSSKVEYKPKTKKNYKRYKKI